MKKSNLDERQEQVLLKLEHNCFWIAYWGLLAAIIVQVVAFGFDLSRLAGEWCVFMVLCIYLSCTCLKNGIWDRSLKPNTKTNVLISLIAAVVTGAVSALGICSRYDAGALDFGIIFGGAAVVTFILCFAALCITAHSYKKNQAKMEAEEEEE